MQEPGMEIIIECVFKTTNWPGRIFYCGVPEAKASELGRPGGWRGGVRPSGLLRHLRRAWDVYKRHGDEPCRRWWEEGCDAGWEVCWDLLGGGW